MIRSIIVGVIATIVCLVVLSSVMGLVLAPSSEEIARIGLWAAHNQLINQPIVKVITVSSWSISAAVGGLLAGWLNNRQPVRAALISGITVTVLWGSISVLIGGTSLSIVHLLSLASIIPFSALGGYLVYKFRT